MGKLQINGKTISLSNNNFLAMGGEGSVYAKGKTAYKVYTEQSKMIPVGKIKELSVLTSPNIIKPEEVIFTGKKPVGYTMRYIKNSVPLCRIFTKSFKDKNVITPEMSFDMVKNARETLDHIHSNNCLAVDLNEMNFLTSQDFKDVYFIDVDSYQTPTYPATALMDSIRDRHNKSGKFSNNTDWFSFAIVSFQLFVGIHPYKGKHKNLKGFDDRMINNVSVFNKDVKVPKSCYSFDLIPSVWKDWYKAVFDNGMRCAPPIEGFIQEIVTVISSVNGSNNFDIKELFEYDWDIINYNSNHGNDCVICSDGFVVNKREIETKSSSFVGNYNTTPFSFRIENDLIKVFNITNKTNVVVDDISATDLMSTEGRVYAKQSDKILEIEFIGPEHKPMIAAKIVGTVMEKATQLFQGVVIQNMLGSYYVSTFPESGTCVQNKMDDLEGYQIINAKCECGILIIVAVKNGKYDRFIYSVTNDKISDSRIVEDLQGYSVNFTVLDNGNCILLTDTEQIEVFNKTNIFNIKSIDDNVIHGGMKLFHDGNTVMFSSGKKMFKLKMK